MPGIMDHANQKVKPANDVPLHCSDDICEESIKLQESHRIAFHQVEHVSCELELETNAVRDCLKSKISQTPNAGYFQT